MNVVVGHPLERLPCFGSQRSGWQIVPYNTDQNWKEKKKEEAKQFKKNVSCGYSSMYCSWNNTKTIFSLQSSFLGCSS